MIPKATETVFDYNITKSEWEYIRGGTPESYLSTVDKYTAIADIAALYYLRGNEKKAEEISMKLPPYVRVDLWRTLTHP